MPESSAAHICLTVKTDWPVWKHLSLMRFEPVAIDRLVVRPRKEPRVPDHDKLGLIASRTPNQRDNLTFDPSRDAIRDPHRVGEVAVTAVLNSALLDDVREPCVIAADRKEDKVDLLARLDEISKLPNLFIFAVLAVLEHVADSGTAASEEPDHLDLS